MVGFDFLELKGANVLYSPTDTIDEALKLGKLQSGETLCDLGSSWGEVLIRGAERFDAFGDGYEWSPGLVLESRQNAKQKGLDNMLRFHCKNLFQADLSETDLVYMFLSPMYHSKLRRKLKEELKKTARIVTIKFPIKQWTPHKKVELDVPIFLYEMDKLLRTRPFQY